MMTSDEYREYCLLAKAEPGREQKQELKKFLQTTSVKHAMHTLFEQIEGTKQICLEADLASDAGVRQAMKAQGEVKGMLNVIERLLDMAANLDEEGDS